MSKIYVDEIAGIASANTVAIPGHVIQVVRGKTSTRVSTSSTSYQDFISLDITPKSATSTLVLTAQVYCHLSTEPGGGGFKFYDATSSSDIGYPVSPLRFDMQSYSNTVYAYASGSLIYDMSSWGTTQRTLKLQVASVGGTAVFNEAYPEATSSSYFMIQEIAG